MSTLVEQNIQLVLRGAAGVLGCRSATYLRVDEEAESLQIWVGHMDDGEGVFRQVERLFGLNLGGGIMGERTVVWKLVSDSIVFESYSTGRIIETSSLQALVGRALPPTLARGLGKLIGERHFVCVPVTGQASTMGVILFEKKDANPFNAHQREMLLNYANRVGLVLESERFADGARSVLRELGDRSLPGSLLVRKALASFLGDAAEAMISLDSAQTITSANTRAEDMFGQPVDELKARPFEVLFEEQEGSRHVLESRMHLISDGYFETRAQLRRKGSKSFPAFLSGLVTVDEKGVHVGSIVRIRDLGILDREAQDDDPRNRILRSERLAMMGQMAAQMAHEIRNPLVSIGASLRELLQDIEGDHLEARELANELRIVSEEVDRLDAILREYLALARHPSIQPARIRVGIVLEDAVRITSQNPDARNKRIDVSTSRKDEIIGDADALRQVFINLLLNALQASPPMGEVTCRTFSSDDEVVTEITDAGRGLPGNIDVEKLFEPFFSTKAKGSGLGLAVTRKIVDDLGGSVTLASGPGGTGVVARVAFPVPGRGRKNSEVRA